MWELQQQWKFKQQRQRVTDQDMQNQLRLSLHAADISPLTPSDWVVQTTEDGSEQYYYNPRTQEMRYSMPPEGVMEEKLKQALGSSSSQGSLHESYQTNSPRYMDHENSFEKPPVRPERAPNRMLAEEFGNDYRSNMRAAPQQLEEEYEDDDRVKRKYSF